MNLRKSLGKICLLSMLLIGSLGGARMTPDEIDKIMDVMHRTQVVRVQRADDDKEPRLPAAED